MEQKKKWLVVDGFYIAKRDNVINYVHVKGEKSVVVTSCEGCTQIREGWNVQFLGCDVVEEITKDEFLDEMRKCFDVWGNQIGESISV